MIKIKHKCRIKTTKGPLGLTKLRAQNFAKENSKKNLTVRVLEALLMAV